MINRAQQVERAIAEQVQWMTRCGADRAGYIRTYGSINDLEHVGDGGEAIYEADARFLASLRQQTTRLSTGQAHTAGMRGLRTLTRGDVTFVRLPRELWRPAGSCRCGHCDGEAYWDTLAVSHDPRKTTWTVHYPELESAAVPVGPRLGVRR